MLAGAAIVSTLVVIGFAAASANAQKQAPTPPKPRRAATTTASSTTTTVPPSTTTTAAPTTTTVPAPDFRKFAGSWGHHGAWVTIDADGAGRASWRTYQWCSDDPTPPCDGIEGNYIIDGGHADFRIVSTHGEEANAVVMGSSQPGALPDGATTLSLISDHGLHIDGFSFNDLCGEDHWTIERCGA
jgi:hypothetical protein